MMSSLPEALPAQLTTFIGRETELAELQVLVATTRLVTLTGAGGVGKTRLALQLASGLTAAFADGLAWVELASLAEPARLPELVARTLGLTPRPDQSALAAIQEALRRTHVLLLLDNCEHLIGACAELVEALLRACAALHILTTSREVLGLAGERAWRVPSLSVPDARVVQGTDELVGYEAVRLFVDRARAASREFTLTDLNAPAVAEVCCRLDGIPLALELAAARTSLLTVQQIAARLDDRFRLLTGGAERLHLGSKRCAAPSTGASAC
jgi:predicted ATPase